MLKADDIDEIKLFEIVDRVNNMVESKLLGEDRFLGEMKFEEKSGNNGKTYTEKLENYLTIFI